MRIFIDSASLADIEEYDADPYISGFTTNATLIKNSGANVWDLVRATSKDISIEYDPYVDRPHVRWKVTNQGSVFSAGRWNLTAICSPGQVPPTLPDDYIISVFAGRIMDTGRDPRRVLDLARKTGAQVLWASSRSVYDITMAELFGCDIITVTPAIYEKHRAQHGKPLEAVAAETIAQFERDR